MINKILFHLKALEEFNDLNFEIKDKFQIIFRTLEDGDELSQKKFKHLKGTKLVEARVKVEAGIYRGIGHMLKPNLILLLFFKKTSQKTPLKEINTAKKRLEQIEIN